MENLNTDNGWDAVSRILHWLIAGAVAALVLTALAGEALEETKAGKLAMDTHYWAGISAIAAVAARLLWGLAARGRARLTIPPGFFQTYPARVAAELRFLLNGEDSPMRDGRGHNPLALPVYLLALALFAGQAVTGLLMEDEHDKPASALVSLAQQDGEEDEHEGGHHEGAEHGESVFEELHEAGLFWVPLFILIHLAGVTLHWLRGERWVLRAMMTGEAPDMGKR
ncbi:MAG: cytochrome b/b6 domain-containing protein [Nitrospinae bacterium]|nr:cytochrome b/b6 domain-containing protein [Nitrospinota bacterium]